MERTKTIIDFDAEPKEVDLPVPRLSILSSAEMIELMGEGQWRIPTPEDVEKEACSSLHSWTDFEGIIEEWVNFCNLALEGSDIVRRAYTSGKIIIDTKAIGAWDYARKMLGSKKREEWNFGKGGPKLDFERRERLIEGAGRAFASLLDEDVKMRPWDTHKARKLVSTFEDRAMERGVSGSFRIG